MDVIVVASHRVRSLSRGCADALDLLVAASDPLLRVGISILVETSDQIVMFSCR